MFTLREFVVTYQVEKYSDTILILMLMKIRLFFVAYLFTFCFQLNTQGTDIELKNNHFYIDGEKYFIKGIGYEVGAYPGMFPERVRLVPTYCEAIWNESGMPGLIQYAPGALSQTRNCR